jgi:hypothetical protein
VAPQPGKQLAVAVGVGAELGVGQQPTLLVDDGGVVVRPWVSTPPMTTRVRLAILSLPFLSRDQGTRRLGRRTGQWWAWDSKLVPGHAVASGRVHDHDGSDGEPTGPTNDTQRVSQPQGQTHRRNPGPSSPNEPGGIFTANLKGQELPNHACRLLEALAGAAERGIYRLRHTHH